MPDTGLWVIALVLGAVVLIVVAALLFLLYRSVQGIESEAESLVGIGERVAANTTKINDLLTTASVLRQIKEEVLIHEEHLSRQ